MAAKKIISEIAKKVAKKAGKKANVKAKVKKKLKNVMTKPRSRWGEYWKSRGPKGMRNRALPESWGRNPRPKTVKQLLDDPIAESLRGDKKMWGSLKHGGPVYNNKGIRVPGMRYGN